MFDVSKHGHLITLSMYSVHHKVRRGIFVYFGTGYYVLETTKQNSLKNSTGNASKDDKCHELWKISRAHLPGCRRNGINSRIKWIQQKVQRFLKQYLTVIKATNSCLWDYDNPTRFTKKSVLIPLKSQTSKTIFEINHNNLHDLGCIKGQDIKESGNSCK